MAIPTTRVLWDMVHILHAANDEKFGEPLPSGWEHCIVSSIEHIHIQGDITNLFHSVAGQTWHTNLPTDHSDVDQGRK